MQKLSIIVVEYVINMPWIGKFVLPHGPGSLQPPWIKLLDTPIEYENAVEDMSENNSKENLQLKN